MRLHVYFGDAQWAGPRLASAALVEAFALHGVAASALVRGVEGFGLNRLIHTERFPDISTDLPLVAVAVDARHHVIELVEHVDRVVADGLITLEPARLARGTGEVAAAEVPAGPGRAVELSVYCGRGERRDGRLAYREAVDVLRRHGAAGATVLLGVDGTVHGRRRRASLLGRNRHVPMLIVAVGPAAAMRASLADLAALLDDPLVTLQPVTEVKQAGRQVEALPTEPPHEAEVWQAIHVHSRNCVHVAGGPLYAELTRRLRRAGAAGATTIRGAWGFLGEEQPYGERLWALGSQAPTCTICVDRPDRVAELWPIIDELTAEHALVTSRFLPAARARAGREVRGGLELTALPSAGRADAKLGRGDHA